jgi:hypothetical protein
LNTLSAVLPSSTTRSEVPSVTMPLPLLLDRLKLLAALCLPGSRLAAPG